MRRPRKIAWPPPAARSNPIKHNTQVMQQGEPDLLPLKRWATDDSLMASTTCSCCDCGLRHFFTYAVVRDRAGDFYLDIRGYRLPDVPMRKPLRGRK